MTVHRRIVELRITPDELMAFNPPRGIIMLTLEDNHRTQKVIDDPTEGRAIIEFGASDGQPEPILRKNLGDIRHHLGDYWRNRIINDAITYHPKSPRRLYRIEALLDHPLLTGRPIVRTPGGAAVRKVDVPLEIKRLADGAKDVTEVPINPDRLREQMVIATENNAPFWIKSKYTKQEKRLVNRNAEEMEEELGPPEEMYDYGTIEEG